MERGPPESRAKTLPDTCEADCAGKPLRELEMERRRIICNQIVRRKKLANWIIAEDDKCRAMASSGCREDEKTENDEPGDTIAPQTIDTSSIIENKGSTKQYWEARMMAEQLEKCDQKSQSQSVKLLLGKVAAAVGDSSSRGEVYQRSRHGAKLGSDGESETSPDTSLSPVDVDSLEESTSEGRRSPDGEVSSDTGDEQPRHEEPETEPAPLIFISCNPLETDVTVDNLSTAVVLSNEKEEAELAVAMLLRFEERETDGLLSTVIEEEQEPDSLEEFIKHEELITKHENELCLNESQPGDVEPQVASEEEPEIAVEAVEPLVSLAPVEIPVDEIKCEANGCEPTECEQIIEKEKCEDKTTNATGVETLDSLVIPTFENSPFDKLSTDVVTQLCFEEIETPLEFEADTSQSVDEIAAEVSPGDASPTSKEVREDVKTIPCAQPVIASKSSQEAQVADGDVQKLARSKTQIGGGVSSAKEKAKKAQMKNEAELRIASEIKELKKREDELRRMREELMLAQQQASNSSGDVTKESSLESPANDASPASATAVCSDVSSVEIEGRCSPSSEMSTTDSCSGRVSADSLESSTCSLASAGGKAVARTSERIKVKPFEVNEEAPIYEALQESPIEREIRSVREREEELRLAKASPTLTKQVSAKSGSASDCLKLPALKQTTGVGGNISIQKLLATTRIQQEIEEQTQREMALRASGSIKTISQERTDIKVSKLGEIEKTTVASEEATKVLRAAEAAEEKFEKRPYKKSPIKLSTSQSSSPVMNSIARKPCISPLFGIGATKNISMHKFITSKGRSAGSASSFAPFGSQQNLSSAGQDVPVYQELRPPSLGRGYNPVRRGSISAESKIQEELKEMRAREEELRNQRTRSQCNLTLISGDGAETRDDGQNGCALQRTSSNPTLSASSPTNDSSYKEPLYGACRKKSSLIARWEEMITQREEQANK